MDKKEILMSFDLIEKAIDGRKLYSVTRICEQIDYVLALDEEDAQELIEDEIDLDLDADNIDVTVNEVTHNSYIDYESVNWTPTGVSKGCKVTNMDILKFLKEIERKKKIQIELDEKQLKFKLD